MGSERKGCRLQRENKKTDARTEESLGHRIWLTLGAWEMYNSTKGHAICVS